MPSISYEQANSIILPKDNEFSKLMLTILVLKQRMRD